MTEIAAADRRLATLFVSFEREAFFDRNLHAALVAQSAPPVIGLTRRTLEDPDGLERALERARDAVAAAGGPLIVAVEGALLVGPHELAFRLPQGRLFTGRRLRGLLDAIPAPAGKLLLLDGAVIRHGAPAHLEEAYAEALAETFGVRDGDDPRRGEIVCVARAPSDAGPLAPRFAAAFTAAAAAARTRAGDQPAWLELGDIIERLPGPGARPVIEPDLPALARMVEDATGEEKGRITLGGFVVSTTDLALPAAAGAGAAPPESSEPPPPPAPAPASAPTRSRGGFAKRKMLKPPASRGIEGAASPGAVEKAVAAMLHHTVPALMRAHRAYPVDVAISKDRTGAAAEGLEGVVRDEAIQATGLMAVRLVDEADAFEIRGLSQQIQDIDFAAGEALGLTSDSAVPRGLWRFSVRPKRLGAHRLTIEAACYVRDAGGAPLLVPSATNRVQVRVGVNLGHGLMRVASWLLMGVLGVLVFKFGVEAPLEQAIADGLFAAPTPQIETGG